MSIGCCGRPTANLEALAYSADLYPRSTKAGQKARVRLALAMVERRGIAQGRPDIVAKARRGLAGLGTVTNPNDISAAVSRIRSVRTTSTGVDRLISERRAVRSQANAELAMSIIAGVVGLATGIAQQVANDEAAAAARDGRPVNMSAADTTKALSWVRWVVGGDFPVDVGEGDLRAFNAIINNGWLGTTLNAALDGAVILARQDNKPDLVAFLGWLKTYFAQMKSTTAAAVASLPVPAAPPAPPPPPPPGGGGFVVGPATGIRCPEGQVGGGTTGVRCHVPCTPPSYWNGRQCTTATVFIPPTTPKSSSSVVLALPAALVLWYLFK